LDDAFIQSVEAEMWFQV